MRVSEFNNIVSGKDGDLARNNLYSIEVYMPRGHGGEFGNFYTRGDLPGIKEKLSYMAKTVTLPSKALGTMDTKRFGPVGKVANDLIIDTASMTFMCSADYKEHLFFDGWISGIMGQIKNPKTRQEYTLSYYNDYVSQVNIIPLDRQGGAAAQVTLKEAYPTNLGPIEFAWSDAGEVATFTVTWTFRDWNHTQTAGWWADTDRAGANLEEALEWDFESQEYREAPGADGGSQYPTAFRAARVGLTGQSTKGFRESPAVIRKAESKMGSGLDHLNAPITPIGRSKDGFREAPDNRDDKYPGVPGESKDGFREASKGGIYPSAFRAARVGLTGESKKGFRESPAVIKAEKNKMGSGLDHLNAPIGRSKDGFREAPDNRNNKYPGVPGESKVGVRESAAVIKSERNKMGSGLEGLNAPTDEYREAPGNRNNKYPGVPGESKDGFREAPSKWVNPDTIPSHKTRPAPGHDGSLVKGLKGLLNILIR